MHPAQPQQAHAQRLEHVEVVHAEQFHVVLRLGEQAALDPHPLGGDGEGEAQAAQAEDQPGDAERADGQHELAEAVDRLRMAGEQGLFHAGLVRRHVGVEVRAAVAAFARRRLDQLGAGRAALHGVVHGLGSLPLQQATMVAQCQRAESRPTPGSSLVPGTFSISLLAQT